MNPGKFTASLAMLIILPLSSNIKLVCFSFPPFLERHQHRGLGLFSVPIQNTKAAPAQSKQTQVECGARTGAERDLTTAYTAGDTTAQLSLHFLQQKLLGVPTQQNALTATDENIPIPSQVSHTRPFNQTPKTDTDPELPEFLVFHLENKRGCERRHLS